MVKKIIENKNVQRCAVALIGSNRTDYLVLRAVQGERQLDRAGVGTSGNVVATLLVRAARTLAEQRPCDSIGAKRRLPGSVPASDSRVGHLREIKLLVLVGQEIAHLEK